MSPATTVPPIGRVGNTDVALGEILYTLKISDRLGELERALDDIILSGETTARGIEAEPHELQAAADRFRRRMGLFTAASTHGWLDERSLSVDDLEEYLRRSVGAAKLREQVTTDRVEPYFTDHRPAFDMADIDRIVAADADTATLVRRDLDDGTKSFGELADDHSIGHLPGGRVGPVRRMAMEPSVADAVFSSADGEIVGPIEVDGTYHVVRVNQVRRASLDEATRRLIEDTVFDAWLAERRAEVGVSLDVDPLIG